MKRCAKCILPESYPGIVYDGDGVCNRCHEWETEFGNVDYPQLKTELDRLVAVTSQQARAKGLPYDVIVPVSGGKDSAYVLYIMKEHYKSRVLAVNYMNTMQTEQAQKNLFHLIDNFDVDFRMLAVQPSLLKRAYNEAMKQLGEFCLVCNCTGYWVMLSFLYDQFSKYGYVPLIVGGWSRKYEFDPRINTLDFVKYYQLLEKSGLLAEFGRTLRVDVLEMLSSQHDVRQETGGGYIQLPDYMEWDHGEILRVLKQNGWQPMKNQDTHFDCWASPLADKLETVKYGLNQKSTITATMVRVSPYMPPPPPVT